MKIAILLGEVTGRGGMETVISDTVIGYNASVNNCMKVFVLGGSRDETWLERMGGRNYHLLCSAKESKVRRYLKCMVEAPSGIKAFEPDIILGADEKAVLYAKIISKFLNKKPEVGTWIHFSLTSISPFYKKILKSADFHLAISEGLKKEYIENGLADESSIHLVYNPLNMDHPLMNRPLHQTHFIYVGRLIYDGQKRVSDLLRAVSQVAGDWKLTVIGDGEDKNRLVQFAADLGIGPKVSWLGWQDRPFACIEDASLLVLTSEYEGFGMVLVEAMARGIPCVSSDCPVGPSDIIKENENGWLYPIGDNKALAGLLNDIVAGKRELPDPSEVRQSVEKYDIGQFIERMNRILENEQKLQRTGC